MLVFRQLRSARNLFHIRYFTFKVRRLLLKVCLLSIDHIHGHALGGKGVVELLAPGGVFVRAFAVFAPAPLELVLGGFYFLLRVGNFLRELLLAVDVFFLSVAVLFPAVSDFLLRVGQLFIGVVELRFRVRKLLLRLFYSVVKLLLGVGNLLVRLVLDFFEAPLFADLRQGFKLVNIGRNSRFVLVAVGSEPLGILKSEIDLGKDVIGKV